MLIPWKMLEMILKINIESHKSNDEEKDDGEMQHKLFPGLMRVHFECAL